MLSCHCYMSKVVLFLFFFKQKNVALWAGNYLQSLYVATGDLTSLLLFYPELSNKEKLPQSNVVLSFLLSTSLPPTTANLLLFYRCFLSRS